MVLSSRREMWSGSFSTIRITTLCRIVCLRCMPRRLYYSARQRRSLRRMPLVSPSSLSSYSIHYFFSRPRDLSIIRVSSAFPDVGHASSTLFQCGHVDGSRTSVTNAGADTGTRDDPYPCVRTRYPSSAAYLDIRSFWATVCGGDVGCRSGTGSDG